MKKILLINFLFVVISCSRNPRETGVEVLPDMVYSVAYEAYSENTLTKDGKTMMLPPKGSIARGKMPYPYPKGDAGAELASIELSNPLEVTKQSIARGKEVFENYCLVCHGETGEGDGPIIPKFPNPPSFYTKRLRQYSDGRIYHIIMVGSGDMPSHGEQIDELDRWRLIHYIKDMQGRKK